MRKLKFEDTTEGKEHYEICVQALLSAGRPIQPTEWDDFLPLKRKLVAIGLVASKQPAGTLPHRPTEYDLNGTSEIELERGEYNLLLDLIKQPNWNASALESVILTRDWIASIKDYDKNGVSDA